MSGLPVPACLPRLCELTRRPNSPLRGISIYVQGTQVPWVIFNGQAWPLPLGRRAP